jgi:hypothetical protein
MNEKKAAHLTERVKAMALSTKQSLRMDELIDLANNLNNHES